MEKRYVNDLTPLTGGVCVGKKRDVRGRERDHLSTVGTASQILETGFNKAWVRNGRGGGQKGASKKREVYFAQRTEILRKRQDLFGGTGTVIL